MWWSNLIHANIQMTLWEKNQFMENCFVVCDVVVEQMCASLCIHAIPKQVFYYIFRLLVVHLNYVIKIILNFTSFLLMCKSYIMYQSSIISKG